MIPAVEPLFQAFVDTVQPDEDLYPSEWLEKYMIIPPESSGGTAIPWRNDFAPYLVEPLDTFHPSCPSEITTLQKSIQICASEAMNGLGGWVAHSRKKAQILVQGTVEAMEDYSDLRIKTMIRETPALAAIMSENSRDETNKKLLKIYPGGFWKMSGANSPVSMRSYPVPYLLCDEVDGWVLNCGGEGAPFDLVKKRTYAFSDHKIWMSSSPKVTETSVICAQYDISSQGIYHVGCPFCGTYQPLIFGHLVYKKRDYPAYECEKCNRLIEESYKYEMLLNGKWVHRFPDNWRIRGFFIDGMYSPVGMFNTWSNMVYEHKKAVEAEKKRDKRSMVAFKTTLLGLPVSEEEMQEDEPDISAICQRQETMPTLLPEAVKLLTCAVDVQDMRLEAEIFAWAVGKENWSWRFEVLHGSPGATSTPNVWTALKQIIEQTFPTQDGRVLNIASKCIDTGGHFTEEVYAFAKKHRGIGVFAVKGSNKPGNPLLKAGLGKKGQPLILMGTESAKDTMYNHLTITEPGPGYCHFPDRPEYDEEYFLQLFAEEPVTRISRGQKVRSYVARRKRNEKCDLRVMNYVALALSDPGGRLLAVDQAPPPAPEPKKEDPPGVSVMQDAMKRLSKKKGNFINGWRG